MESQFTGAGVHTLELGGRVADLGRVQTDPDDRRTGLLQSGQRRQGVLLGPVAVEAGDQLDGRAVVEFGGGDARRQPVQDPLERDATGDVGLQWYWQEEFSLRCAYDYTWQEFRDEGTDATSSGAVLSVIYQPLQRRRARND